MAVDAMLKIAITPVEIQHDEPKWITAILDSGWDYVHLRHPQASLKDIKGIIERIPPEYQSKLRLHGHFDLVYEFNIGGLHLNSRCSQPPVGYNGPCSRSCHSINELSAYPQCDYLTLSPIFDSLSKPDYNAAFTADQLMMIPTDIRVIALGGVTPMNISLVAQYKFAGYAVLGYIWNSTDIEALKRRLKEFK